MKVLPFLSDEGTKSERYVVKFRGINYGENYTDGEFAETTNLSSEKFPCITPRRERMKVERFQSPSTLHTKDGTLIVDGTNVWFSSVALTDKITLPDENLVKNPSFEDGFSTSFDEGNNTQWFRRYGGSFALDSTIAHDGKRSLKMMSDHRNYVPIILSNGTMPVKAGKKYEFSAYFLTKDPDAKPEMDCYWYDSNGEYIKSGKIGRFDVAPTSGWTKLSNVLDPPENAEATQIVIRSERTSTNGAVWLDSVSLVENEVEEHANVTLLKGSVTPGKKQIATVGNLVCIFPDKKYLDVTKVDEGLKDMEASYSATNLTFTHNTITAPGGSAVFPFRVGDAVEISGCSNADFNKTPIIRGVSGNTLSFYDNTFPVEENATSSFTGELTLKRSVPDLDFVCESNYRLWGTKGNTIYGSKYADPLNFSYYDGLSGDSYAIDVGTDGAFTGCFPYSAHICFFKENTLHKLYGTKPSNFQIVTSSAYGVQAGSERSLVNVNEQLFYKGVNGVYVYTGGIPELISDKFALRRFSNACAASDGERYYISMQNGITRNLYVFDVLKGIWVREDDLQVVDMGTADGNVYILAYDGYLYLVDKEGNRNVEWSAEFCPFNETMDERKGYSRFTMRVDMAADAWLSVDVKTDNDAKWKCVYTTHNERERILSIPIIPTRCDSVSIRVYGKGDCTIKSFVREFSVMSDT